MVLFDLYSQLHKVRKDLVVIVFFFSWEVYYLILIYMCLDIHSNSHKYTMSYYIFIHIMLKKNPLTLSKDKGCIPVPCPIHTKNLDYMLRVIRLYAGMTGVKHM